MAAMLSSALPELSIESNFADFLPAPAAVFNVALAFTFFMTIRHCSTNPLTLAVNAFGDLFSSTKPKEVLVQVSRVPTSTVKVPPTPAAEYRYQPESTSNIFYAVSLCAVSVMVGAIIIIIVLRKRSTANLSSPSSSVNPRFDIGSTRQARRASDNLNRSSSLLGDIPKHFGSDSRNLAEDNSSFSKNPGGFLEKLKTFLILFSILTFFTHGGRITQKIRSLSVDHFTFSSDIPTATLEPYFHQVSELVTTPAAAHFDDFLASFSGGNILVSEIVETLTFNILYSSTLSSNLHAPSILSSGLDEKFDSISLLPLPTMTSNNPTSAYPSGLSLVTITPSPTAFSPTTTSFSKAALDQAFEFIKLFILFSLCILIPILSFLMTVLPAYSDYVQLSKAISADQRENPVMEFVVNVNEVVPAIEVVKNNKVDINRDIVDASAFIDKGKGKAIEATEESLDLADPTDTPLAVRRRGSYVRPSCSVRKANKRIRRAEKAAIEAALNAPFL